MQNETEAASGFILATLSRGPPLLVLGPCFTASFSGDLGQSESLYLHIGSKIPEKYF